MKLKISEGVIGEDLYVAFGISQERNEQLLDGVQAVVDKGFEAARNGKPYSICMALSEIGDYCETDEELAYAMFTFSGNIHRLFDLNTPDVSHPRKEI
jgi:hypothetical protein